MSLFSRCLLCLALASISSLSRPADAQAIANVSGRPFVVGIVPVVGRFGAVGGVLVDADGVLARATPDDLGRLRDAWTKSARPVPPELAAVSRIRKVSLRRLELKLGQTIAAGQPLPDEVRFLAGLQRVEYVFVYPADGDSPGDIVLAGPAESWTIDGTGHVVGERSRRAVLQLEDLLDALRAAEASAQHISCSIDPSPDGLRRLQQMTTARGFTPNTGSLRRLEAALGPQRVTLEGVDPQSHFARVLVASDFLMKRLAMNLEPAPVPGMPSYLQLLQSGGATPRSITPRWWMACNYDPMRHDPERLAWQLSGPGVKVLSEDAFLARDGELVETGRSHPLAQKWADSMTDKYELLSGRLPVLRQLRNCMDLAVVAELIFKEDMEGDSGYQMSLLLDAEGMPTSAHHAPQAVDSRASLIRSARQTVVSVSGGVEIDPWTVLDRERLAPELLKLRAAEAAPREASWWWD